MSITKEYLLKLKEEILASKEINYAEKVIPKMNAYSFLKECNKDRLDNVAINYLGRTYTYSELFKSVEEVSKSFYEIGVRPGDMVTLGMLSTPEAIISFYALNNLGAHVYLLNATHDKHSIKEELSDANSKFLIINDIFYDYDYKKITDKLDYKKVVAVSLDESFMNGFMADKVKFKIVKLLKSFGNAVSDDKKCIRWKKFRKLGLESKQEIPSYYEENYGVAIAATSGTTGQPKKPFMTNENLNSIVLQMGMTCDTFAPNDKIFTTLPIWILYSLFNSIHEPLCLGVTLQLDPLYDAKSIEKRLEQYKFNHWNTIPTYVDSIVTSKKLLNKDLSFLKSITTGGDFRTPSLKYAAENKLKENNSDIEIGQGYGASECGGCFCYTYEKNMPADSIGKPLVGNHYKILDPETGKELGPNESGQLYLYSPTLMKEYYKSEELTNQFIIIDEAGNRWYDTYDYAHYNEKGELFMDGRKRRIEMTRDANGMPTKVFPDKVKQVISMHPAVDKCEIIMVDDNVRIKRPVAYIVLKEDAFYTSQLEEQINDLCVINNIESYAIPTEYFNIEKLPLKPSLKVDLDVLQQDYIKRAKTTIKKKLSKR